MEGESINLRFAVSYKFQYLGEPLVVMREHDSNIGKAIKGNVERLMIVLDRLKSADEFPTPYRGAVEVFRSRILRDAGWQGVRVADDPKWARRCFLRSLNSGPRQALHPRTVAGLLLSCIPASVRGVMNRVANSIRGHRGVGGFLDRPELEPR